MRTRLIGVALVVTSVWRLTVALGDGPVGSTRPVEGKALAAQLAPELEKAYGELSARMRAMDRQRFDSRAVLEKTGRDPQKLLEWVRDNTDLLPYRGALRGATGVLMDRGGNSLDRSLLLAQMMDSAGFEVRLANATLTTEQSQQLLARVATGQKEQPSPAANAQVADARVRVKRQAELLLKSLGTAGDDAGVRARQIQALADHWWVQRKQDGKWVDADPAGIAPAHPARTIAYAARSERLPIEAKDCQEVELRVVIEAFKGGRLQNEVVLHQVLRPAEMLGRAITFTNALGSPINSDDFKPDAESRKRLKAGLVRNEVYFPVLQIDSRPVHDASFTTAGDVNHSPQLDPTGKLAGASGKAMSGMFGGVTGQSSNMPNGVLTAEWLEYEVRVPGQAPRKIRHEVFDVIGPSARAAGVKEAPKVTEGDAFARALRLMGQTQVLVQPCELSADFVMYGLASQELRLRPVWLSIARGELGTPARKEQALDKVSNGDSIAPLFALIRNGLNPGTRRTFIDQPNVILYSIWADEKAGGDLVTRMAMDLAATSTAAAGPGAFQARVERGVADTLAEQLALGPGAIARENTVGVFEAAANGGASPVVVEPKDVATLARLTMPNDARERAKADLAAGNVLVLASADPGRWAWWRVDPGTGQCIGVMDSGYHQSLSEREADLDAELAGYSERQGVRITRDGLRRASPEQIAEWAQGHEGVQANLEGLQTECEVLGRLRDALRGSMI